MTTSDSGRLSVQHRGDPIDAQGMTFLTSASQVLAGGGEMGALMRDFDWASTPLGPVEGWPQSLKTTVGIVLASPFPMLIWWGTELRHLYNDGYRPVLGGKHPASIGARGSEVWAEIWHILGPRATAVLAGGAATFDEDLHLPMNRFGFIEETYFTFSYSPIPEPAAPNGVGGVLVTCRETTAQVVAVRRVRALRDLGARSLEAESAEEACTIAASTLSGYARDVPFALIYLLDGGVARLAGVTGLATASSATPDEIDLEAAGTDDSVWPLGEVVRTGRTLTLDGVESRVEMPDLGPWPEPPTSAVILPIPSTVQDRPAGVLVAGVSPRLALDEGYQTFLELVTSQVGNAITNARAYEEERRRAEALAELDRAKTAFFSNVSHEFRTPLTLILGLAEDASTDVNTTPANRERLAVIHRNALRLHRLVNTLLEFSRIEAGRVEAVYEPIDLAAYTAELVSSFRSATERAGLELIVDAPPLDQPVYVDREMWEKIVLNLVSNAFKHTFDGRIAVSVREVERRAELVVRDTGVGVPAAEIPRVFDRFHRVPNARSRTHEGTGIGLALVQELVWLHGGQISLASEEDVGTTVTVRIPLGTDHLPSERIGATRTRPSTAVGAPAYVEEAMRWLRGGTERVGVETESLAERTIGAMSSAHHASSRGSRVLLADDNADLRDYVARLLSGEGWVVEVAADGQEALTAARASPPDLVLADVMMPVLDGFALLRALRADANTRVVPVILLSARAGEESRIEGLEAGADDYVVKPFSGRELTAKVAAALELARARRQASAEIAASRDLLIRVLEQAPVAVCMLRGPDHVYEIANTFYRRIVGGRELVGRSVREAIPEAMDQGFVALLDQVYASGVPYVGRSVPLVFDRHGDGNAEECYFNLLYYPFTDFGDVVSGVIAVGAEITEEVRARRDADEARAEAEAARESAEEANRAKSEFLTAMSHELRTPLNAIAGYVQLIEMEVHGPVTEPQRKALARIDRSEKHLLSLINDILNFAKLEAGRVEFDLRALTLADVLAEVIPMLEPQIAKHGLALDVRVDRAIEVRADREKLQQILLNLLSNAIKFTARGGRIIIDAARRDGAPPSLVFLRVSDTGIGVPRERQDAIFDPFVQLHRGTTHPREGTGLGLAISRDLARGMGGDLRVRSVEGRGSAFTLSLPGVTMGKPGV